ncbi:hypothetical protein KAI87_11540, partial [Myxococcota bacterium]|nr:hypothetical protein [Myxococcota bacterium]
DPANRDNVTLLILRFASIFLERSGLFLATRKGFLGLGGFAPGYDAEDFVKRVRRIRIPVTSHSIFNDVLKYRSLIRVPMSEGPGNEMLISGLGDPRPIGSVIAVPMISGDRIAAILYGDNPSGEPIGSTATLEIFMQHAGLLMDRTLLERQLGERRDNDFRGGPKGD